MQVTLEAENGRRLTLGSLAGTSEDLSYLAKLTTEAGEAEVAVWEYNCMLARFIRDLADAWKGFDGVRQYVSTEHHLKLSCEHDGRGTVACEVTVGSVSPPEWSMSATLAFGAGSHLEGIADDVERFFAGRA